MAWMSQADAVKELGISRQQLHKLRAAGRIRFRQVKTAHGLVPEYRVDDIRDRAQKRLQGGRVAPGRPRKGQEWRRPWQDYALYEVISAVGQDDARYVFESALLVGFRLDGTAGGLTAAIKSSATGKGKVYNDAVRAAKRIVECERICSGLAQ